MHFLLLIGAIVCFLCALNMHLEDMEAKRQYEEEHWIEALEKRRRRDKKYRSGKMGKLEATKYEFEKSSLPRKILTIITCCILIVGFKDLITIGIGVAVIVGIIVLVLGIDGIFNCFKH